MKHNKTMITNYDLKQLNLNGQSVYFHHPKNDDTIYGTLSCLRENKFHLDQIDFQPNDVFIDLGSNIGLVSLVVAKLYPDVRIYAFDASPIAIECLRLNCAVNKVLNIQSFHLAVGGVCEKGLRFSSNSKEVSCLVDDNLMDDTRTDHYVVNKVGIGEILGSPILGIDRIKFLKCDIEGSEFEMFDYLFEHADLLDRIDFLHLEIHPFKIYHPEALKARIEARFGRRVFFDT